MIIRILISRISIICADIIILHHKFCQTHQNCYLLSLFTFNLISQCCHYPEQSSIVAACLMMQQYVAIPNAVLLHMALIALVVVLVYENFIDGRRVKVGLIDLLLARLSAPRDSLQSRDDEEDGQRSAVGEGAIEYDKHASRNSSIRPRLQKSIHVRHASTPETVFSILNVRTPHNDTHYSSNVVKFTSNTRRCNTTINKSYYIVTTKSGNDKYGAALQRNNISSSSSSFSLSPCGKEGGRSSNSFDSVESTPITPSTTQTVRVNPGSSAHAPALVSQFLPGCEPGSPAAVEMSLLFPDVAEVDICRFLVARKGSVDQAADMLRKRQRWYKTFFPLKFNAQFEAAIASGCFFPFGETKDKTPVLYFRGLTYLFFIERC